MRDDPNGTELEGVKDVENVLGVALFALGHGARGHRIDLQAVEFFRRQFARKICSAVQVSDWRHKWRDEEAYLVFSAGAMGQRAARLAAEEGRAFITKQDLEVAMTKLRGHLPVAGRWCPF